MLGPKIVGMATYPFRYSDEYLIDINSGINYGYGVGFAFTYNVNEKVLVNFDGYYSNKGRSMRGGFLDEFRHRSRYTFIEAPVSFRYKWKREKYDLFISGGGNFSYWLGGQGEIFSFEYDEAGINSFKYTIKKGTETSISEDNITISQANDIIVGLDIGGGIMFKVNNKQWVTIEVKYQHGHSWLGEDEGIDVGLVEYFEDYRTTLSGLVISGTFQWERKIGEGRKGKTNYGRNRVKRRKK